MLKRFAFISLMLFISAALSTTMAQRRKTVVDLIVRGGTVVTMDDTRRIIENGAVAIKNGRIVARPPSTGVMRRARSSMPPAKLSSPG